MLRNLMFQAVFKIILGIVMVGLLIFFPAGTLKYTNGWILIVVIFVPMLITGIVMMHKCPDLLKKRLNIHEKHSEQRFVVVIVGILFVVGFVVAGLDYRYRWWPVSEYVSVGASVVYLVAYLGYVQVLKENPYLSRTVEIQENQKLIDTGMYAIVRHPMYSMTVVLFFAVPLILGSLYSLAVFIVYPFAIVKRIKNEEQELEENLDGFSEYKNRVKYRLIPYVW